MKTKIYVFQKAVLFSLLLLGLSFTVKATVYSFGVPMSGGQENPPNGSTAQGAVVGNYNDVTNVLNYAIGFRNLGSPTTAGHFHAPAGPGANAGVIHPFTNFPVGVMQGVFQSSVVLTEPQETSLKNGLVYSNIHTSGFPGGEIRGQIILNALTSTTYPFIGSYSGTQENPPNASPGIGLILGVYDAASKNISYILGFSSLGSGTTAAHFHAPAAPGTNASVIIPKAGFPTGVMEGFYSNQHTITAMQETWLLKGLWYSNIHTSGFPGGEIRAQLMVMAAPTFLNDGTIVLNASCFGNDGNLTIIPQSGVPPFMYSKDGGATYVPGPAAGFTFTNLSVGSYDLRLKDANGMESEIVTKTIVQQYGALPTFINNGTIVLDATCGNNDGNISIIPTSGGAPFMYSIDGGTTYVAGPDGGYTFVNLAPGTYHLRLKAASGCESDVVERTVEQNCPRSTTSSSKGVLTDDLSQMNKTGKVATFPNPSKGIFKVQLSNFASSRAEVSVFDGKGTLVQKRLVNLNEGSSADFNLTGRAPGLYYIKTVSDKGTTTSKVMVQR